ncbi:acetyl/propionyl/methylcrotonyl-CoA carboxylase subunit alpha [Nocardioides daphniae]|uniref:Acetyl/propionyl-CoA carboxylase subuit alpha n=1 Tax=Nocardioides daphniae TaxID=402297 RepID=A0ABQ1Q278_9ACTN|nr:biotin carboxylase N-terminal domain-containing protein [Nocardioides daphniae]GGD09906.1 acetyl/propionyl-CoA carboxylase subuit alpha [Nocardioides daphniae]
MAQIKTLLVANRGEIALRVFRTCSALGIRTVAIHTAVDADAPHVREADVALQLPGYLDVEAVVAAAKEAGADAVHPGYGFLSERSVFARALEAAGLTLVGPSADVMDAMGRKDAAREIAVAAGVPVIPAYDIDDDPQTFSYPVLVKAAAGGGGKGMRVVRSADDFAEARAAAAREGLNSFGDDTLLVEKYVESGRHIEVQVMADAHGTVRHLFERDCSTQRRHQKVLEEAPAPTISAEQRTAITASAVALAAEVGYTNAGTVEFLLDNATGEFYFLEMNTRLQVEHPVTEEVVRIRGERPDLVALQLAVAAREPLDFSQDDVTLEGHAIEARVYAEDSFNGFLPQAGTATYVRWGGWTDVASGEIRVDHALESGQEVSTHFDPMLGKVIAYGADRSAARAALVDALDETAVLGLTTNTGFLRTLAASDEFGDATIDTAWLDRNEVPGPDPSTARTLAAALAVPDVSADASPFHSDGWRLGGEPAPVRIHLDEWVEVPPGVTTRTPLRPSFRGLTTALHGKERAVGVARRHEVEVVHRGQRHVFAFADPFADSAAAAGDGTLTAPMPGTVLEVKVAAGDRVEADQTLGMMEAMKMELSLKAPFAGTVTEVGAGVGDLVTLGATLFVVEAEGEA